MCLFLLSSFEYNLGDSRQSEPTSSFNIFYDLSVGNTYILA